MIPYSPTFDLKRYSINIRGIPINGNNKTTNLNVLRVEFRLIIGAINANMFRCTKMSISQKCAMIRSTFEYHLHNYINLYHPKFNDVSMLFNI